MKDKIIHKATEMFLKLGFKSVTMDDIANEMGISKKTIYKYFENKEVLIEESTSIFQDEIHQKINEIRFKNFSAIQEHFEIREFFKKLFKSTETSPVYQLKKHYPEIYIKLKNREINECKAVFKQNIIKGIETGFYRNNFDIEKYVKFYYTLIFNINENVISEKELQMDEFVALEYNIRAMATVAGIAELDKQLLNYTI